MEIAFMPNGPDFTVENHGSIFLLKPQSKQAVDWVDEHIGQETGFQPYFPTVIVEPRYIARHRCRHSERRTGGVRVKTSKVLRIKTGAAAHIVFRNGAGRKLVEIDLPSVRITVTVPSTVAIEVELKHEEAR
jgi:hypothetical protein